MKVSRVPVDNSGTASIFDVPLLSLRRSIDTTSQANEGGYTWATLSLRPALFDPAYMQGFAISSRPSFDARLSLPPELQDNTHDFPVDPQSTFMLTIEGGGIVMAESRMHDIQQALGISLALAPDLYGNILPLQFGWASSWVDMLVRRPRTIWSWFDLRCSSTLPKVTDQRATSRSMCVFYQIRCFAAWFSSNPALAAQFAPAAAVETEVSLRAGVRTFACSRQVSATGLGCSRGTPLLEITLHNLIELPMSKIVREQAWINELLHSCDWIPDMIDTGMPEFANYGDQSLDALLTGNDGVG